MLCRDLRDSFEDSNHQIRHFLISITDAAIS